jgi:hypothetical protein
MKNLSFLQLLVLVFAICSLVACTKEESSKYISGEDITQLLREDLEAGIDIDLPEGHFYTSESIFVDSFNGTVSGAGKDKTIIEAAQGFKALPDPYINRPGTNVSEMFSVAWSTGDITFRDMTFLITGEAPAEPHNNPFMGTKTTIDNVIAVTGGIDGPITVTFKNLKIKGETSSDPGADRGKNLMWPLIVCGMYDDYRIDMIAENCEVDNSSEVAIEYWYAHGGTGEINGNVISNSHIGIWLGAGLEGCELTVQDNVFSNMTGPSIDNTGNYPGCFMNNTLDGEAMTDSCPE